MLFKPFGFYKQAGEALADRILDTYSGAVAGYSLRLLSKNYTGDAIEVTRTSDSATLDIGFDVDGNLDESALTTFIGANTGVISKWYDQSGNSEDMVQATGAARPTIVSSGTLITQGGLPAIRFDGSSDFLKSTQTTNPFTLTTPISVVHATYKNSTTYKAYETVIGSGATGSSGTNNTHMVGFNFGNSGFVSGPTVGTDIWRPAGVEIGTTVSTNSRHLVGYYISNWSTHRSTGTSNIRLNGSDETVSAYGSFNPDTLNTQPLQMGVFDTILAASYFAGDIQEILIWTTDLNADRVAIETNVNDYYSIY